MSDNVWPGCGLFRFLTLLGLAMDVECPVLLSLDLAGPVCHILAPEGPGLDFVTVSVTFVTAPLWPS